MLNAVKNSMVNDKLINVPIYVNPFAGQVIFLQYSGNVDSVLAGVPVVWNGLDTYPQFSSCGSYEPFASKVERIAMAPADYWQVVTESVVSGVTRRVEKAVYPDWQVPVNFVRAFVTDWKGRYLGDVDVYKDDGAWSPFDWDVC